MYLVKYLRKASIELCRLRCKYGNLNQNLFNILQAESAACECGYVGENDEHYFLHCVKYNELRFDIVKYILIERWQLNTMYHGSDRYSKELNAEVCTAAQRLIEESKRFY